MKSKILIDNYFMNIAIEVSSRSVCLGRNVGAIIVFDGHILSTGYNGTPSGLQDCQDGGCYRCDLIYHKKETINIDKGFGYDICTCCHAEENCITQAAKFGISINGGSIYTTLSPCFLCSRMLLQCGIKNVFYKEEWIHPNQAIQQQLNKLNQCFLSYRKLGD